MSQRPREFLKENSTKLRNNMTPEEKILWYQFLRLLPVTVNRQRVIGNYIVDFYCASAKTVIEIDGWQHYEEDGENKDKLRDEYLKGLGLTILRYSNRDINKNFKAVCADIYHHLNLD